MNKAILWIFTALMVGVPALTGAAAGTAIKRHQPWAAAGFLLLTVGVVESMVWFARRDRSKE